MASNITGIIRHNNFLFCKSIPKLNLDLKQFLKEIGKAKVVLYVIIPVMDNTYESFINLFF
ncbi:MAG: hypothetical protein ABF456_13480, partial [Lacticaseibacillus paracasei]